MRKKKEFRALKITNRDNNASDFLLYYDMNAVFYVVALLGIKSMVCVNKLWFCFVV